MALLEAAIIYWIRRLLFIQEDSEIRIQDLEKENEKLKSSVSRALAESYFWNFAFKVAEIIKSFEDETVGIEYKDGDGTKVGNLEPRKFLLFIPYNWDLNVNPVTVNQIG